MEPEMQENSRNPDGTFKPGVSGNPAGRPKGKTMKEFAREMLMQLTDEEKIEYLKSIPKDIVWKMAEGNPKQDTELSGQVAMPIIHISKEIAEKNGLNTSTGTDC